MTLNPKLKSRLKGKIVMPKLQFEKLNAEVDLGKNPPVHFHTARPAPQKQGLDYTFRYHKEKIKQTGKDKGKLEDYVFDLENTWTINIQMFENMLEDFCSYKSEEKKKILNHVKRIKDFFMKKKQLREDKIKLRGKILMDKQIMEEYRRRTEENSNYYQEQMVDYRENLDKKESFVKQFEKKFNEVEIYVQRESNNNQGWSRFGTFEIVGFINNNEMLHRKRLGIIEEIKAIKDDISLIVKENVELKKRDEFIDMSEDFETHRSKYKNLIKLYKSKIKFLERKNEHLRGVQDKINLKFEKVTRYNRALIDKFEGNEVLHENTLQNEHVKTIDKNFTTLGNYEEYQDEIDKIDSDISDNEPQSEDGESDDPHNKSNLEILFDDKNSYLAENRLMITRQNKEWDVSRIENMD